VDKNIISVLLVYRDENQVLVPIQKGATIHVDSPQDPVNPHQQWDDDDFGGYYVDACIDSQFIVASAPGFTIEREACKTSLGSYTIILFPVPEGENANYAWTAAGLGSTGCTLCHADKRGEWEHDGHSTVFSDGYFGTMYTGTNVGKMPGIKTPLKRNSTGQKLREQSASPYGPGYLLDHENEQGNCAYCHAPTTVQGTSHLFDLSSLIAGYTMPTGDVRTEGITCDVCHKVTGVRLDENQLPFSDQPGVLSLSTAAPDSDQQIILGPMSSVTPPLGTSMSCSRIFNESKLCAACHYGKFSDTLIYNSYGEWLNSKYSRPSVNPDGKGDRENPEYRTCQECHMLPEGAVNNIPIARRRACSGEGDLFRNFDHNMMKYGDTGQYNSFPNVPLLIEDAARLNVRNEYDASTNSLRILTTVENVKAGHKFPTDSPLRHLILVVEARDELGNLLPQINGDKIPLWGGVGDDVEDYAGMPGEIYANLLADRDTNVSPTAAYWNPVKEVFFNNVNGASSDTRLNPNQPDDRTFVFAVPSSGFVSIHVKLIYRYAFIELASLKGWTRQDVVVTRADCEVNPAQLAKPECP
jgi:hypothetical protein